MIGLLHCTNLNHQFVLDHHVISRNSRSQQNVEYILSVISSAPCLSQRDVAYFMFEKHIGEKTQIFLPNLPKIRLDTLFSHLYHRVKALDLHGPDVKSDKFDARPH